MDYSVIYVWKIYFKILQDTDSLRFFLGGGSGLFIAIKLRIKSDLISVCNLLPSPGSQGKGLNVFSLLSFNNESVNHNQDL